MKSFSEMEEKMKELDFKRLELARAQLRIEQSFRRKRESLRLEYKLITVEGTTAIIGDYEHEKQQLNLKTREDIDKLVQLLSRINNQERFGALNE